MAFADLASSKTIHFFFTLILKNMETISLIIIHKKRGPLLIIKLHTTPLIVLITTSEVYFFYLKEYPFEL